MAVEGVSPRSLGGTPVQVASEVEHQNGLLGRAFLGLPGSPTSIGGFGQASSLRTFLGL